MQRIVVKIGSGSLVDEKGPRLNVFKALASQIAALKAKKHTVVLVSSGAGALGRIRLGLTGAAKTTAQFQACAAAGQSWLMRLYEEALGKHALHVGQILLTHNNFSDRESYLNAKAALGELINLDVLPVINENDTVAVDEIRFGDNDQLAAMVTTLVDADLLVLLTDVEGVQDAQGKRIARVTDIRELEAVIKPSRSKLGRGGMQSKVNAAAQAAHRGVTTVIAPAQRAQVLEDVLAKKDVGTWVMPQSRRLPSRKHWIAYTLKPKGVVMLDAGAAEAVGKRHTSVLAAGVAGVRGDFDVGDAVVLTDADGKVFGRGLARISTLGLAKVAGLNTDEITARFGAFFNGVVVHRDDLVVFGDWSEG